MPPALELAGQRFGRIVVLERAHQDRHHAWMWRCKCDCGSIRVIRGATLVAGRTKACTSCASSTASTTHGMSDTPLYWRWRSMLDRTSRPRNVEYRNYGARGIRVCERWTRFENFLADMGPTFSPDLELDRIDVDGNYEPANCRWVSRSIQQRNKRNNHYVTWLGQTMVAQDWATTLGIKPNTLIYRLRRGWSVDRALTTGAEREALLRVANGGDRA